ncbi:MAG: hypothetical protein II076_06480, partial [Bacteroidales bacterium]|nr:hypothetical protein [Bacteroidales bacterium]
QPLARASNIKQLQTTSNNVRQHQPQKANRREVERDSGRPVGPSVRLQDRKTAKTSKIVNRQSLCILSAKS